MTVVITGASRGIGEGLARAYAARGTDTIGTTRDAGWQLDVTDPGSVARFAGALEDRPVDLLVCNAGVYLDKGHVIGKGYQPEIWARSFAANVTGVFLTIEALLPALRRADSAKIAIISSQMASSERAPGGSYVYRASKAAVLNLGRNLAADLASEGIAVGIYHPGWVKTDMGSMSADITVEEAVAGLMARFEALNMNTTGCFETWDGRAHPF
ncbi:SDR family oxidoreductase [Roseobacter ponti]|uniref:SDR family oxidoreductase n=1 Tax=Roseobacter ponti TaxID=1891787 RepID=A0A858SP17_9RHOB|nr:SDR family oxidoreductase [Roseobacter ponti]QJF50589.1 SDR family oxidoreductase [Roseobacter ponti]